MTQSFARKSLQEAIAAGELGLAASLVTAAARDAVAPQTEEADHNENTSLCSLCSAPLASGAGLGGCVACVEGHAIHASCAADWLLGGGVCPTCRAPLFEGRVPGRCARAANLAHETVAALACASMSSGDCVRVQGARDRDDDVLGEFIGVVAEGDRTRVRIAKRNIAAVMRLKGTRVVTTTVEDSDTLDSEIEIHEKHLTRVCGRNDWECALRASRGRLAPATVINGKEICRGKWWRPRRLHIGDGAFVAAAHRDGSVDIRI